MVGLVIFVLLVLIFAALSFVVIPQEKRAVVETFGKFSRYLEPGLHFRIPFVDKVKKIDIREQTVDIQEQEVISKDNTVILVDGVIWHRVSPTKETVFKAFYEIDDLNYAIQKLAQTNIRDIVATMTFDESLASRELIGNKLTKTLAQATENWGARVTKVEIQKIDPPKDIILAMHKEKTAEQVKRALIKEAEGYKTAKIEKAEGDKQEAILQAEGEARAKILRADADAAAIKTVSDAAEKHFKSRAEALKKLDVAGTILKDNTKFVIPSGSNLINLLSLGDELGIKTKKKE
ncbi:SPFH/Band 7/PHB domain protein [Candidatus Woesearchaeota archaeon CG_4_10_14_0_8_um_filter_47_5]|nr:MAG: SPFH/Band 7/PHB domain protein [Candidatus Woesearchaeota archaeon CG_4_10_14_0_8_um_filter_47_5]